MKINKVLVTWMDIMSYAEHVSLEAITNSQCALSITSGFLIKEHADRVVIAHTIQSIPQTNDLKQLVVLEYSVIPKGCIVSMIKETPIEIEDYLSAGGVENGLKSFMQ